MDLNVPAQDMARFSRNSPYIEPTIRLIAHAPLIGEPLVQQDTPQQYLPTILQYISDCYMSLVPSTLPQDPFSNSADDFDDSNSDPFFQVKRVLSIPCWGFPANYETYPTFTNIENKLTSEWTQQLKGMGNSIYLDSFIPATFFPNTCLIPFNFSNHLMLAYCHGDFTEREASIFSISILDPAGQTQLDASFCKYICMYLQFAAKCSRKKVDFTHCFKQTAESHILHYEFIHISVQPLLSQPLFAVDQCVAICKLAYILFYRLSASRQQFFRSHDLQLQSATQFFGRLYQCHKDFTSTAMFSQTFRFTVSCYIEMLDLPQHTTGNQILYVQPHQQAQRFTFPPAPTRSKKATAPIPQILDPPLDQKDLNMLRNLPTSINDNNTTAHNILEQVNDLNYKLRTRGTTIRPDIARALQNITLSLIAFLQSQTVERVIMNHAFFLLETDLSSIFTFLGFNPPRSFSADARRLAQGISIDQAILAYQSMFILQDLQNGSLHNVELGGDYRMAVARQAPEVVDQPAPLDLADQFVLDNINQLGLIAPAGQRQANNGDIIAEPAQILDIHPDTGRAMQVAPRASPGEESSFFPFTSQAYVSYSINTRPVELLCRMLILSYNDNQQTRVRHGQRGYYTIKVTSMRKISGSNQPSYFPFFINFQSQTVIGNRFNELLNIITDTISAYLRAIVERYEEDEQEEQYKINFGNNFFWSLTKPELGNSLVQREIQTAVRRHAAYAFTSFSSLSTLVNRYYCAYFLKWGEKHVNQDQVIDLEYLEDSQHFMIQLCREHKAIRLHPCFKGQPCLQIIVDTILAQSLYKRHRFTAQEQFDLDDLYVKGEYYTQAVQDSRLYLMDTQILKGSAKVYMKSVIEKCKASMHFLKENPSLDRYLGEHLCRKVYSMFTFYLNLESNKRLRIRPLYRALSRYCVQGKTANTVTTLNQLISEATISVRVYYLSIHSLTECIHYTVGNSGVERTFSKSESNRLINHQLQINDLNAQPPCQDDFVILTTVNHALLFKVNQLLALAHHIFTQSYCKAHTIRKSYEQHCLLFKDLHNLEGKLFNIDLQAVNPDNMLVQLETDIEDIAQTHAKERLLQNKKFIERYSNFDFNNQPVHHIKLSHFRALDDARKMQLLVYLTNKKLVYKTDKIISELYQQDTYYFNSIFGAIQIPTNLSFNHQLNMNEFVVRQRTMKFYNTGLLAFDCETFTYDQGSSGNQHVWAVSVYGRARSLNLPPDAPLIKISKIFSGIHAMDDFVDYLLFKGILLNILDENQCQNYIALQLSSGKVSPNTIYAHNGNRFDFRLLIQSLNRVCRVSTVGDLANLKKISTPGCMFMDSLLVIKGSLAKLAKMYQPAVANRMQLLKCTSAQEKLVLEQYLDQQTTLKIDCALVKGFQFEEYRKLMRKRQSGEGSPELDNFEKYCLQDSVALYFTIHMFLEMNYTFPFERKTAGLIDTLTYLPTMFPLSTASLSTEVYKLAYSNQILRANRSAIEIERTTFCGGFTTLFSTRLLLGFGFDINSCYASAMCNPMPAYHKIEFSTTRNMKHYIRRHAALPPELQQEYVDYHCLRNIDQEIDISLSELSTFFYEG